MDQFYPIVVVTIDAADGGGYMGFAPDLHGCMSHGDTPAEAFTSTEEAVLEWLEEAKARYYGANAGSRAVSDAYPSAGANRP